MLYINNVKELEENLNWLNNTGNRSRGKESTEVRIIQDNGKEREKLKRSP